VHLQIYESGKNFGKMRLKGRFDDLQMERLRAAGKKSGPARRKINGAPVMEHAPVVVRTVQALLERLREATPRATADPSIPSIRCRGLRSLRMTAHYFHCKPPKSSN
jgi:hypothetical protein